MTPGIQIWQTFDICTYENYGLAETLKKCHKNLATKSLETVSTRSPVPATGSFYSARDIGSQASVGAAVDKEWRRSGKIIIARLAIA